ncbi:MAG TPA: hypothetical protein VIM07_10920 [Chitinophagaceae bacterium]
MSDEQHDQLPIDNNGTQNETGAVNNDRKITYHHYGKLAARNLNANANNLGNSLDNIYERFLREQKLDEDGVKQRIKKLRDEMLQKKNQKETIKGDIFSIEQFKEEKENRIEELEIEKIKLKDGEAPATDYLSFIIGAFITILLTLYLFVFYSSSGYSAFYGVKQGSLGFINPNVFADAQNKGGGVVALIILFPVIFLGMGFLIHDALEKKKYAFITGLLFFTLITDGIIGYKISQAIHTNEFNAGLTNELWKFNMIYSDVNFYLVLVLGFVVYIIWGALLHYVLNKNHELQPDKAFEIRLENLNRKISEQRQALSEYISKINTFKSQLLTIDNDITDKEKDIIGYENGVVPINISLLQASVGDFMMGWFSYTNLMFPYDANKRTQEAREGQIIWIDKKIQALNTDK